jgi:hypothetical protein
VSHANRPLIERQAANASTSCSSCVKEGFACSVCGNMFVIGDLRIVSQGGTAAHWPCAQGGLLNKFLGDDERCDVLTLPEEEPSDPHSSLLLRLAKRIADSVNARHDAIDECALAGVQAEGYVRACLPWPRPPHAPHVISLASEVLLTSEVCDFCSAKNVVGKVEVKPFRASGTGAPGDLPLLYEGAWSYCSGCAAAVACADHVALAERAMAARSPHIQDPARRRSHFVGLYQKVMTNKA